MLGVAFVAVRALGTQARFLPVRGVGTVASSTVRWRPGINCPGRWTHTGHRSAQGELVCKMQGCGGGRRLCHLLCQQPPSLLGGGVQGPHLRGGTPSLDEASGSFRLSGYGLVHRHSSARVTPPRGECPAETVLLA